MFGLLAGVIFNAIWLGGAVAFGWLLTRVFLLVDLPAWLEIAIIIGLSFWAGLMGMALTAQRASGESWSNSCRFVGLILSVALPTIATCILGVASYLLIHLFSWDAESEKYAVYGICGFFWFVTMHLMTQKLEKKAKE